MLILIQFHLLYVCIILLLFIILLDVIDLLLTEALLNEK